MKKKIIIISLVIVLIALLFPIKMRLKDGGSVKYNAVLYTVTDVKRLADVKSDKEYEEGLIVEILGMEVYNNVR